MFKKKKSDIPTTVSYPLPPLNERDLHQEFLNWDNAQSPNERWMGISGAVWEPLKFSHSFPANDSVKIDVSAFDVDALWDKMYKRVLRVIVTCTYCNTPQTIDNGSCMKCGAPLPKPTHLGE